MSTLDEPVHPAPRTTEYALRYGMNDLLSVTGLFGLHMGLGMLIIPANTMSSERTEKVALCAVMGAALAFAAAYLTFRLATKRKIEDFGTRLTWLILFDIMLIAVWPVGTVLIEIIAASGAWLPLLAFIFFMGYITGRATTPQPKARLTRTPHPGVIETVNSDVHAELNLDANAPANAEASRI